MSDRNESRDLDLGQYQAYLLLLARACMPRWLRVKITAADLVQETLLKAEKGKSQFRGSPEQVKAWLRSILGNTIVDQVRKYRGAMRDARREQSIHQAIDESSVRIEAWLEAKQSTPSKRLMRQERFSQLAQALRELPEDQREALELHYFRGLKVKQVAEQMGRTRASVAGLVRRGLADLRANMDDSTLDMNG